MISAAARAGALAAITAVVHGDLHLRARSARSSSGSSGVRGSARSRRAIYRWPSRSEPTARRPSRHRSRSPARREPACSPPAGSAASIATRRSTSPRTSTSLPARRWSSCAPAPSRSSTSRPRWSASRRSASPWSATAPTRCPDSSRARPGFRSPHAPKAPREWPTSIEPPACSADRRRRSSCSRRRPTSPWTARRWPAPSPGARRGESRGHPWRGGHPLPARRGRAGDRRSVPRREPRTPRGECVPGRRNRRRARRATDRR